MKQTEQKQKTIVLVEDETPILSTLAFILKREGYSVHTSENGIEAIGKINQLLDSSEKIDLLVTDIQMSGMNGMELIDKVNALKLDIPVLVITGYGNKEVVVELLRKGCMDYIDKPFKPDSFLKQVNEVLTKEEKRSVRIAKDKAELLRNFENYKFKSDKLFNTIKNATRTFYNLIEYNYDQYTLPLSCRSLPLDYIGGDLFLARKTANGYDFMVADVAGHDMSASFYAVLIKGIFDECDEVTGDGSYFFTVLNDHLVKNINEKILITAVFVGLDLKKRTGEIVLAGHYSPVLIGKTGTRTFPYGGNVIGVLDKTSFERYELELVPGERLLLYTDGLINVTHYTDYNRNEKKLLQNGLLELIQKWSHLPLKEMVDHIFTDVLLYCDQKPRDDILLAGIEIPEPGN